MIEVGKVLEGEGRVERGGEGREGKARRKGGEQRVGGGKGRLQEK